MISLKAACRTALQTADKRIAVSNLRHDLTNAIWHALGYHLNCRPTFCTVAQMINPEEVPGPQVDFHRSSEQRKNIGSIREIMSKAWENPSLFSQSE